MCLYLLRMLRRRVGQPSAKSDLNYFRLILSSRNDVDINDRLLIRLFFIALNTLNYSINIDICRCCHLFSNTCDLGVIRYMMKMSEGDKSVITVQLWVLVSGDERS